MSLGYQFEDYISNARQALNDGDADIAMDWVKQALSLSKHLGDGELAVVYQLKARVLIAQEQFGEAEEALQKSLDIFPRDPHTHVLLGELMLLDDRNEQATSAFESALEIDPHNPHALSLLVFCFGLFGRVDSARECFDKCVSLDPENADAHYHMGICLFRSGNPQANPSFEKALSSNPVLSGPHYYLGRMRMAEGSFAEAERELQRELELNPANTLAELQLIRLYLMAVGSQDALDIFDRFFPGELFCEIPSLKACRFHFNYELLNQNFIPFVKAFMHELPQTPDNLFHVAKIYRFKSLFGEAVELLKKTLEAESHFRPAYTELAEIFRIQGDFTRACDVLEKAAALFGDAQAYCHLGKALLSSASYSEAEQAAQKAVSLNPDLAEAHCLLGVILADAAARRVGSEHLLQHARNSLLKALEIDPQHSAATLHLMRVAFQSSEFSDCLRLSERALGEDPQDRAALFYSGRSYLAMGNLPLAEDRLATLVELHPDDLLAREALAEAYRARGKSDQAAHQLEQALSVPGRRPPLTALLRLGELYLLDLDQQHKARECFLLFLQSAPAGHPDSDRVRELLARTEP